MSTESIIRLDVPSANLLDRLVHAPLLPGVRATRATRSFLRDIYFDTLDAELQQRGVSCRFRIGVDDRRSLTVTIRESAAVSGLVEWMRFESEVDELEAADALEGTAEPARRLRAVIDPRRLGVRLELEVDRRVSYVRSGALQLRTHEIAYDLVTVRSGTIRRSFQEIIVRRLKRGGPDLEVLGTWFRAQYGLRPVLVSRIERAEQQLEVSEGDARVVTADAPSLVALVFLRDGCIALVFRDGDLTLPVREGSGREACAQMFDGAVPLDHDSLRLIDTVRAGAQSAPLEIWLASSVTLEPAVMAAHQLVWMACDDVFALAGSPVMRDPSTLHAHVALLRSDVTAELFVTSGRAPAPRVSRSTLREQFHAARVAAPDDGCDRYLNPELSWLAFNERLIDLAEDQRVPLLERVRFLSIFGSNLDEFFMVRISALRRALAKGGTERGEDGMTVEEQLAAVTIRLRALEARQRRCWTDGLLPQLERHGIRIARWSELSEDDRASLSAYFDERLFPLLTPHAITRAPGHPFPHVVNLSLSIAVTVRDSDTGRVRFGTITVPERICRFVPIGETRTFIPVEEIVRANLGRMYPGRQVEAAHCFRVTRGGDLELDEQEADDLLDLVADEVKRRDFAGVVRLEVDRAMPTELRGLLQRELRLVTGHRVQPLGAAGLFEVDGLLALSDVAEIADLDVPDLHFPAFGGAPSVPADVSIFDSIKSRDILVHHPYDTFEHSTQRFFEEAADDPNVEAIKLTLYRTGSHSPVMAALVRAAEAGKRIDVFVELKARFDEERNVAWVRKLEGAGAHVVYGLVELKTHAKTALVVRREGDAIRRYLHIGTGNYNAATARFYTDLGLLTCNAELGADLTDLFNELTGASVAPRTAFRQIIVAPTTMLREFTRLIAREAEHARAGRGGRIRVKMNGVADAEIVSALYDASNAGVDIDMVVRSICTLRPRVPGLSEHINVVASLGQFLEHARIYHFANGGNDEYYIGSADWRPRNLRRRVELVTPVRDPDACARLDAILEAELGDPTCWELESDGTYTRRDGEAGRVSAQQEFIGSRMAARR